MSVGRRHGGQGGDDVWFELWGRTADPVEASARMRACFGEVEPAAGRIVRQRVLAAHGWPLAAFGHLVETGFYTEGLRDFCEVSNGIVIGEREGWSRAAPRVIGFEPLWGGLAVDLLIYSGAWSALLGFRPLMRRCLRRSAGTALMVAAAVAVALGCATSLFIAIEVALGLGSGGAPVYAPQLDTGVFTAGDGFEVIFTRASMPGAVDLRAGGNGVARFTMMAVRKGAFDPTTLPKIWFDFLEQASDSRGVRRVIARGWPFPCLWDGCVEDRDESVVDGAGVVIGSRAVPANAMSTDRIPMRPLWDGLLLDTAIFAIPWFVLLYLLAGPRSIRGAWRLARGQCPRCRYDVRAQSRCPECGTEIAAAGRSSLPKPAA